MKQTFFSFFFLPKQYHKIQCEMNLFQSCVTVFVHCYCLSYRSIYLGETFSCYISVHNDSNHLVKEILVKTDLQTSSQRLTLSGGGTPSKPELPPEGCIDEVIHHEVKELGTHM